MSDRGALLQVKHLLARNAGIEYAEDGAKRIKMNGQGPAASFNIGYNWEGPATVYEVVEAAHFYQAIVYMYRPYSYEGQALLGALHHIRYLQSVVEPNKAGEKKQLKLMEKLVSTLITRAHPQLTFLHSRLTMSWPRTPQREPSASAPAPSRR